MPTAGCHVCHDEDTEPVRGNGWTWFSALSWWRKALIGVAFGIVLLLLLLLPDGLGAFVMMAAVASVLVASISGLAVARFALDRAWDPAQVRRVGSLAVWSTIVLTLAIGLIALLWRDARVLWLWTVPASLGGSAWLVFELARSMHHDGAQP